MTEGEWLGNDEPGGFYGTGLVVGENGELAIVHAEGDIEDWNAYQLSEPEANALYAMIGAVLG